MIIWKGKQVLSGRGGADSSADSIITNGTRNTLGFNSRPWGEKVGTTYLRYFMVFVVNKRQQFLRVQCNPVHVMKAHGGVEVQPQIEVRDKSKILKTRVF